MSIKIGKIKLPENKFSSAKYIHWTVLSVITLIFIVLLYPNLILIKSYTYNFGDVVERDIKAPRDFFIQDKEATEFKRKQAVEDVFTVYDHDTTLLSKTTLSLKKAFEEIQSAIAAEKLSLRQKENIQTEDGETIEIDQNDMLIQDVIFQKKDSFEKEIGISISNGAFKLLIKEEFNNDIRDLIIQILTPIYNNGIVINKEVLLKESSRGIVLRRLGTKTETEVQNLKRFYGLDQAKTMVRIIGQPILKDLNYNLINLIVDISQRLIHPNITLNRSATEELKKKAASEIKPILYKIKAGEMIMREGERVSNIQLLKLKELQSHKEKEHIFERIIGAIIIFITLFSTCYLIFLANGRNMIFQKDHNRNLLFVSTIFTAFLFATKISAALPESLVQSTPFFFSASSIHFGIPLSAGAMLICLFLSMEVAIFYSILISIVSAILFKNRFDIFLFFLISCCMAAYWIKSCRDRKSYIIVGIKVSFLNTIIALALDIYMTDYSGMKLLRDIAPAFTGGLSACIITLGLVPIIELLFGFTTDITLLELANLDRPILRRLMIEAPGTYHHSVIVGTMVEAAASDIDANPLLGRVCGYYHDIGKICKPMYFIENQKDGKNKHDKLAPSMSSLILLAHVKDGVEMAKKHKLGKAITDTIRQSHGTSLISYFYEKAKNIKGEDAVNIADYRYPGPLPQTREAGLVMLADVVEAASRTLENPTPSRIQGLVQNLINKIFSDGQLNDCELTLKDLHSIAKSFNKILTGIHHHRIEYSDKSSNVKGKNGNTDRQQTRQPSDSGGDSPKKSNGHLKRLGL